MHGDSATTYEWTVYNRVNRAINDMENLDTDFPCVREGRERGNTEYANEYTAHISASYMFDISNTC